MTTYRTAKLPAILSFALPLIGFFLILAGLNLYQYYRMKNNIAVAGLAETSTIEFVELQSFFRNISDRLSVVREWGENGILQVNETVELNKKFFPLMNSSDQFTGLLLADSSGTEYYLYRSATGLVTRSSKVKQNTTMQTWQRWGKPAEVKEEWEEKSDYDPRKRPWFVSPGEENKVFWTKKYIFFQSGKPGLTASVSWIDPDSPEKYIVFGLDLLIEDIRKLLSKQQQKKNGILFLINPDAGYSIESSSTALTKPGDEPEQKKIINLAVEAWNSEDKPTERSVSFTYDKQRWLSQFRLFGSENSQLWIGVAASEKDMASELKKILFKVDFADFVVAGAGGFLMLFLVWRSIWKRTEQPGTGEIGPETLQDIIDRGEGAHLEFKASVRYNFKSKRTGKEIEFAWLKAVVAFLNSGGGTLLLGVADDGKLTGIDHDNFDSDDRCLLHVKNLINQHIGADFSGLLNVQLIRIGAYRVVAVTSGNSPNPVFLRVGKNEEFYVRSGPSNSKLSPSQILSYLEKNRS